MKDCKICFKCETLKSLDDFYKHSKMSDGRVNKCKECNKKDVRENRAKNINYYREYDKERALLPNRKEKSVNLTRRYRIDVVGYRLAHQLVAKAIRNGHLAKPDSCERCNAKTLLHAHHDDYDKPLDVMFLCPSCHKQRHKEIGKIAVLPKLEIISDHA